MKLKRWFSRPFRRPDDGASGGGGAVDRGDDFTPTDDADDAAAAAAAAEAAAAAALAAETAAAEKLKTGKAGKAGEKAPGAADGDGDGEGEGEGDGTPGSKKSPKRIPLERHEAMLTKAREANEALVARLAQYEKGEKVADLNATVTAADTKIAGLETQYAKLVADGEVDKAAAVMADIRRTEREMSTAQSEMRIAAAVAEATERVRYSTSLERIEAAFPQLNPDHADYDAELDTDVADLKVTYERKGMTPSAALQKAVAKLVKPATVKQEEATTVTPKVDAAAIAAQRKKDAVSKTLAAGAATPPSTAKVGMDSDKDGGGVRSAKDVIKMNFKDFAALPEEELSRARGDIL